MPGNDDRFSLFYFKVDGLQNVSLKMLQEKMAFFAVAKPHITASQHCTAGSVGAICIQRWFGCFDQAGCTGREIWVQYFRRCSRPRIKKPFSMTATRSATAETRSRSWLIITMVVCHCWRIRASSWTSSRILG